jgi:hypothetical protein
MSWLDTALKYLQDNKSEAIALTGLAGMTGLLDNLTGARNTGPRGYQGSIPNYRVVRDRVQGTYDPARRPGSSGQRYFTDTRFVNLDETDPNKQTPLSQVQLNAAEQAYGLANLNRANPAREEIENKIEIPSLTGPKVTLPASGVANLLPVPTYTMADEFPVEETQTMATGGLAGLAKGRYLRSSSDGMADKIPATIDKTQPAALSGGEYVIPADVVSHLGNGNSDAGAKILDKMMERIRKARTGNGKQGKEIDPNKLLPA